MLCQLNFVARLTGGMQDRRAQTATGVGFQVVVMILDNPQGDASPYQADLRMITQNQ